MTIMLGAAHAHSDYSHDSLDSLEQIRATCIDRGIRWLALTEHAEDLDAEVFAEYLSHCESVSDETFTCIPGLEFRFAGARGTHLLALGVRSWMAPGSLDDFFDHAEERAAFTILAHPVLCRYAPPAAVRARVDAVEVWNARYNGARLPDPRAIDLYQELVAVRPLVVATVGLDQHDSATDARLRLAYDPTRFDAPIAALQAGAFQNLGQELQFDAHATFAAREMRSLRRRRRALDAVGGMRRFLLQTGRRLTGA